MKRLLSQKAFTHVFVVLIIVVVLIVVGLAGYFVIHKNSQSNGVVVKGAYCPNPLLQTPTDISKVTAVLYPGQYRGGNYKAHGGFRFDNSSNNSVEVTAPLSAKLIDGARYTENGETQILLDFRTDCGVNYRFDHLATLSPKIQTAVVTLPAPQNENSTLHNFKTSVSVKTGETVATAVGFTKTKNVAFDFGVYDYRQPNAASKDPAFEAAHKDYGDKNLLNHAVCWFNYIPSSDATTLKALPAGDQGSGKNSDFCK